MFTRVTKIIIQYILSLFLLLLLLFLLYFDDTFQVYSSLVVSFLRIPLQLLPKFLLNLQHLLQMIVPNSVGSPITELLLHADIIPVLIHLLHLYPALRFIPHEPNISGLGSAVLGRPSLPTIAPTATILPGPHSAPDHGVTVDSKWLLIIVAYVGGIDGGSPHVLVVGIDIIDVWVDGDEGIDIITEQCCIVCREQAVGVDILLILFHVIDCFIFFRGVLCCALLFPGCFWLSCMCIYIMDGVHIRIFMSVDGIELRMRMEGIIMVLGILAIELVINLRRYCVDGLLFV